MPNCPKCPISPIRRNARSSPIYPNSPTNFPYSANQIPIQSNNYPIYPISPIRKGHPVINTDQPSFLVEINLGIHVWIRKWPLVGFSRNVLTLFRIIDGQISDRYLFLKKFEPNFEHLAMLREKIYVQTMITMIKR